jgi:hypothetical protein
LPVSPGYRIRSRRRLGSNTGFGEDNPSHPSLHFKRIHGQEPIYAVRVSRGWRALGLRENDAITWFWIASHAEYEHIIG